MRHFSQRVGLVQKLRQLTRAEELLDGCGDGTRVDDIFGRGRLDIRNSLHALADNTVHTGETDPHLILEQFAD